MVMAGIQVSRSVASCRCPLCEYVGMSMTLTLSHIRAIHSNAPNFLVCCGIESCCYTARTFSALYSHVYRRHPSVVSKRKSSSVHQPSSKTGMILSTSESLTSAVTDYCNEATLMEKPPGLSEGYI